jgi:alanine dehydrogenase
MATTGATTNSSETSNLMNQPDTGRPLQFRFLSRDDIAGLELSAEEVIEVVANGLRAHAAGEVVLPPKYHLSLEEQHNGHFNILPGYVAQSGVAGVKVIGDYVDNYQHGLPSEIALTVLYHGNTGAPFAMLDGTLLTWMRTGAVTAIGARHLARRDSRVIAHVGARGTALYNLLFMSALFPGAELRIASKRPESREALAAKLRPLVDTTVVAEGSVAEAVEGADIVVDASRLEQPEVLFRRDQLAPGALVIPYGAVMSTEASLPLEADKLVVDDWAQAAAGGYGQYCQLITDGTLRREHVHAEIGQIVAGHRPGRERDDELIVFWHRGFAISDIMIGTLAYERARAVGAGTTLTQIAHLEAE